MGYGEPSPQHRNALSQVNQARMRAWKYVSRLREVQPETTGVNLCQPANTPDGSPLPIRATQSVADYLTQLRPYREASRKWDIEIGTINLPKSIDRGKSKRLGVNSRKQPLWCCQMPHVHVGTLSDLINALNSTIIYSTDIPPSELRSSSSTGDTVRIDGTVYEIPRDAAQAFLSGGLTPDDIRAVGTPAEGREEPAKDDYQPPRLSHGAEEVRRYKFILASDRLLQLLELADEVADEMDLLIERDDPDFDTGGGGAV